MHLLGLSSNIMSLGGIAIAIGAMVDAAIVMIENAHKHLERAPPEKPRSEVLIEAAIEVGPALFFSLLIITVSFLQMRLGTEFMPNLNEGTLFYMPTTLPGLSVTKAAELIQTQDKII